MSFICIVCRDLLTNRPDGHGPGIVDIISTKCGHMYHLHCLMEWFRRKVDTSNPNHECPYCNAVVTPNDVLRIFPSEDEETEELAAKFNEAKASGIEKEICQLKERVEESKAKFEEEQLAHENLKFDYALKLSEIEQLKRDHEVDLSLLDSPQSNWKAMLDKERKSRNKMLKTMTTLEKRFAKQKADLDRENRRKTEESDKTIMELKSQNESLRKKIERLQSQLQQQPFKPVFPTPAATAPSVSHVPSIVSVIANTSSQSRRRSVPNQGGPMFCPHVTSSSQSQSAAYAMPTFRSSGSAQSHFLNPPNPAQNPYQNLLSAAAAAASTTAVSSQSQSRNNPNNSHGNSNQNTSSNQSHNNPPVSSTSSSSSSAQQSNNPFSNSQNNSNSSTSSTSNSGQSSGSSNNSGGGGGGGGNTNGGNNAGGSGGFNNPNFPGSFPLAQAHNHNVAAAAPHLHPHPSPMHLSMHYSTYYTSSRNPPYPPAPYSFPAPTLSSAAGGSHLSGGNVGDHVHHVQAAHVQPAETATVARAATRLLPAHHGALQFYMQAAAAGGMAETVGVASYPPFLTPTLHPPPLSPRH